MGAVTYTLTPQHGYRANKHTVKVVVNPSTSYATGGDTIPLGPLGLSEVHDLDIQASLGTNSTAPGLSFKLAGTAKAPLLLIYETLNTEVANASNNAARNFVATFIGV